MIKILLYKRIDQIESYEVFLPLQDNKYDFNHLRKSIYKYNVILLVFCFVKRKYHASSICKCYQLLRHQPFPGSSMKKKATTLNINI